MKNDKRFSVFKSNSGRAVALSQSGENNVAKKKTGSSNERHTYGLTPMPINCHPANERDHRRPKGMRVMASRFSLRTAPLPEGEREFQVARLTMRANPEGTASASRGCNAKKDKVYVWKPAAYVSANFYPKPSYDDTPRPRARVLLRRLDADPRPFCRLSRVGIPPIKGGRFNRRSRTNDPL